MDTTPPVPPSVSPPPAPPLQHYLHDLAVTSGTPPDEADAIYSALARDGVTTLPQLDSLDDHAWAGLNVSPAFKNTIRESVGGWTRRTPTEGVRGARRVCISRSLLSYYPLFCFLPGSHECNSAHV